MAWGSLRLAVLLVCSLIVGCHGQTWTAIADAASQVPALTPEAVGGATATFSMWAEGSMLNYTLDVSGIVNFTTAHIHIGTATERGPIIYQLVPKLPGLPTINPPVSGPYGISAKFIASSVNGVTLAEFLDAANSEGLYINLHTVEFPGGAIRGQIVAAGSSTSPAPSSGPLTSPSPSTSLAPSPSLPQRPDPVVFYDNFDYDGPYVQLLTGSWDLSGMPLSSVRVRPGCAVALYKEDGQSYILYEDERAFGPDYNDQVSTAVVTCATNVTIKNACPDAQTYKINYYCSVDQQECATPLTTIAPGLENPLDIDLTFDPYPYIYLVAGASIARIAKFSNGSELTCGTGCFVADVPDVGTTIEIVCAPNAACAYSDGMIVRCTIDGKIYKIEGGAKRWFRDQVSFQAAAVPIDIDSEDVCGGRNTCPDGPDM